MGPRRLLFAMVALVSIACCAVAGAAADTKPLAAQFHFVGRWDLRNPDRAVTVNSGSSIRARFEGTALTARFDLSVNKPAIPTIAWRIDDGEWKEAEIAEKVELASGIPDGEHHVWLVARGLDEHQSRWTPPLVASITFTGLEPSSAGKILPPLTDTAKPALKLEILGDSITEGVLVHEVIEGKKTWPWRTDGRLAYPFLTAERLSAELRQVGFGAQGITHGGSGGTPSAIDTFNFFYKDCPRDDWQPDLVVINQGTNDGRVASDKFRPLYAKYLAMIRTAYPKALIIALRPFNGAHAADIEAEVQAMTSAGDARVTMVNTAGWLDKEDFSGGLHPNEKGGVKAADHLAAALKLLIEKVKRD